MIMNSDDGTIICTCCDDGSNVLSATNSINGFMLNFILIRNLQN